MRFSVASKFESDPINALKGYPISPCLTLMALLGAVVAGCAAPRVEGRAGSLPEGGQVVRLTASNFHFAPNVIEAPAGALIGFEIQNASRTRHNLTVRDPAGRILDSVDVAANGKAVLELPALAAGRYGLTCDRPFHTGDEPLASRRLISARDLRCAGLRGEGVRGTSSQPASSMKSSTQGVRTGKRPGATVVVDRGMACDETLAQIRARGLHSLVGVVYSSNITRDPNTGLGRWSEAHIANAPRPGQRPEGTHPLLREANPVVLAHQGFVGQEGSPCRRLCLFCRSCW